MILNRRITNTLNWILDNLIPPILRDSRAFMGPWFWIMFREKSRHFLEFKEKAPFLTQEEYELYYRNLADKHIQRVTDLNPECIARILSSVVGDHVLDIGCGRGYMVRRIASERGCSVTGIDIAVPEGQKAEDRVSFVRMNIQDVSFPDKSFDTVTCTHTLEHLPEPQRLIHEMRRVARRKIIVVVPRQREYRYTFDLHLHFFPYLFSLQRLMQNREAVCEIMGNDIYYEESVR